MTFDTKREIAFALCNIIGSTLIAGGVYIVGVAIMVSVL